MEVFYLGLTGSSTGKRLLNEDMEKIKQKCNYTVAIAGNPTTLATAVLYVQLLLRGNSVSSPPQTYFSESRVFVLIISMHVCVCGGTYMCRHTHKSM